jgi:hypothetical protein
MIEFFAKDSGLIANEMENIFAPWLEEADFIEIKNGARIIAPSLKKIRNLLTVADGAIFEAPNLESVGQTNFGAFKALRTPKMNWNSHQYEEMFDCFSPI